MARNTLRRVVQNSWRDRACFIRYVKQVVCIDVCTQYDSRTAYRVVVAVDRRYHHSTRWRLRTSCLQAAAARSLAVHMTFTRWIRVSTPSFLRRVVDECLANTSFRVAKNDWQRGRYQFRAYLSHTLYIPSYVDGYCCSVTFVWFFGDTTLAWVTTVLSDAIFVFSSCETARSARKRYKVVGRGRERKRGRAIRGETDSYLVETVG